MARERGEIVTNGKKWVKPNSNSRDADAENSWTKWQVVPRKQWAAKWREVHKVSTRKDMAGNPISTLYMPRSYTHASHYATNYIINSEYEYYHHQHQQQQQQQRTECEAFPW